jgi:Zn-dependent protease
MRTEFALGKIFGITIAIDISWVLIFVLVLWNLGAGVFPALHPNWSSATSWAAGFVATFLFFGSVLAHELAHSLVARARKLPINKITLFVFGGVSNLEREPNSAGTEFLVAVVGPLTSIGLGVLSMITAYFISPTLTGDSVQGVVAVMESLSVTATLLLWLGQINIILGLFNLVPGFPLDGGRLLRATFWKATGNFTKATKMATAAGMFFAWLFICTGFAMILGITVPVFGTGVIGGIWLVLIGWFLRLAARANLERVLITEALGTTPVRSLLQTNARTVSPETSVALFVDSMLSDSDKNSVPVTKDQELVGLVRVDDATQTPRQSWETTNIEEIMIPKQELPKVTPDDAIAEILPELTKQNLSQVPVTEQEKFIGIISLRDILLLRHKQTGSPYSQ